MAQRLTPKPSALITREVQRQAEPEGAATFSRELAARFPGVMIKRFVMPSTVRVAREVFIREVTSKDEIDAAIFADAVSSPAEKASNRLMNDAERREIIRLAIVGIGNGDAPQAPQLGKPMAAPPEVRYRHVNHDGVPLEEINGWTQGAWSALYSYYGEVNGVPVDEVLEGLKGARTVGAFAPPTNATLDGNADGK
jgi:hypothetical protein